MKCPDCQATNVPQASYCLSCGRPLFQVKSPASSPYLTSPIASLSHLPIVSDSKKRKRSDIIPNLVLGVLIFFIVTGAIRSVSGWGLHTTLLVILGIVALFYFLPAFIAYRNAHPNATAIAVLNVFLGWTFLGWLVALIWAFSKPQPVVMVYQSQPPPAPPIEYR